MLDFIISLILIVILFPLFILIGLLILLESEGPIFFKQTRIGLNSKPFTIYKFRSMYISAPSNLPTYELENAQTHVTKVGKFLRKSSIDELPQLYNILVNEMSLIGPRPVIPEEVDLIERRKQYGVDTILPGVTGWAQINGRDELAFEKKAELDHEYKMNMSLKFDIKIMFNTVVKIIKREQISH